MVITGKALFCSSSFGYLQLQITKSITWKKSAIFAKGRIN